MKGKDMHTRTWATRNGEPDRTECAAQRRGLLRQVNDGAATPRVGSPAQGRGQRLGAGANAAGREVLPGWNPADRVGLNQKLSAILAVGLSTGRVATTHYVLEA
jgi:hypothetical protein